MNEVLKDSAVFGIAEDLHRLQYLSATYINHNFSRHYHDTYVIIVQTRGAEDFFCRGKFNLSPAGSLVTLNPGDVHTGSPYENKPWSYKAIYPDIELIKGITSQIKGKNLTLPYFTSPVTYDSDSAKSLLQLHYVLENSTNTLERQSNFITTVAKLIERHTVDSQTQKPVGKEPKAINLAREYIEANYQRNLSIEEISEIAELNPFYLIRSFRKKIGLPPHEFQTVLRIQQSLTLISEGMKLIDVALETGFSDQSHFSNHFKKIMGITPRQFAKGSDAYKIRSAALS